MHVNFFFKITSNRCDLDGTSGFLPPSMSEGEKKVPFVECYWVLQGCGESRAQFVTDWLAPLPQEPPTQLPGHLRLSLSQHTPSLPDSPLHSLPGPTCLQPPPTCQLLRSHVPGVPIHLKISNRTSIRLLSHIVWNSHPLTPLALATGCLPHQLSNLPLVWVSSTCSSR